MCSLIYVKSKVYLDLISQHLDAQILDEQILFEAGGCGQQCVMWGKCRTCLVVSSQSLDHGVLWEMLLAIFTTYKDSLCPCSMRYQVQVLTHFRCMPATSIAGC